MSGPTSWPSPYSLWHWPQTRLKTSWPAAGVARRAPQERAHLGDDFLALRIAVARAPSPSWALTFSASASSPPSEQLPHLVGVQRRGGNLLPADRVQQLLGPSRAARSTARWPWAAAPAPAADSWPARRRATQGVVEARQRAERRGSQLDRVGLRVGQQLADRCLRAMRRRPATSASSACARRVGRLIRRRRSTPARLRAPAGSLQVAASSAASAYSGSSAGPVRILLHQRFELRSQLRRAARRRSRGSPACRSASPGIFAARPDRSCASADNVATSAAIGVGIVGRPTRDRSRAA